MKEEDYKHIAIIHNMAKDYGILTNEEIHKTYEVINKIKQLETNWNELKEWLRANDIHFADAIPFRETLRKMQELEGNKNG